MFSFKYRVGKSYVPIIVSAFALIIGTFEISNLSNLGIMLFYNPIYWLSIALVTCAILLQYLVQNRLERQVDDQEGMIYELQLNIRILELENQIRAVEEIIKLQNQKLRKRVL